MMWTAAKKVLIIQAQMKQYRVPFFERLHRALQKENLRLRVAYSSPAQSELQKGDNPDLSTECGKKVKAYWLFRDRILFQPLLREILHSDLVIVEQANKHLLNHLLLVLSALGLKRVAFWGHGRDFQSRGPSFSEWFKVKTLSSVDWWFAYTEKTKSHLREHGVNPEKITVVQNAVDTRQFREELESISDAEREQARRSLGIAADSQVGLFCASITPQKQPQFLLSSALRIKELVPRFELLVVGGGPREQVIREAAGKHSWIHFLGPQFGRNKALYHRISNIAMMPCAVGLGILDAFAAGLPLLTTEDPAHGPEITYLETGINGPNGIMTVHDVDAYSQAVISLLSDSNRLRTLQEYAVLSSRNYTIENMAERFRWGILACLDKLPLQNEPEPASENLWGCPQ